jgi:uncharacterized protein (DUF58 family)
MPRHATAGQTLRVALRVRNCGRHRLARAWLAESPPDPRPEVGDFIMLREPGEELRNRFDRTFAYFRWQWLLFRRRLFTGGFSQEEIRLKPGGQARVFIEFTPQRRGVIRLNDLRVLLPDPLGLVQKCVKVKAPAATLMVLPRRYPLPLVELPAEPPSR